MRLLRYILQHRYYIKITAIIFLIMIITYTLIHKVISIYNNETEFTGTIYKIKTNNDINTVYLKAKERIIVKYKGNIDNLNLGDKVIINGTLSEPNNNTIPNLFNYKKYLYYNHIFYIIDANAITKISNNTNIIYYLRNSISMRIKKIPNNYEYINTFVLGDNTYLDESIINSYRSNGLSHLFSISGMHISLFVTIIYSILKRISYNNHLNYTVIISFLILYILLIDTPISALRSLIMYIIFALNKIFNLKISRIDIMLIVLIIMLKINPYYIYLSSFEYSYLISFSLVLFSSNLKKYKSYLNKALYISLLSFLISFPITIYNNFEVNIFSVILNIIFVPMVSVIIFPLSLLSLIIPKLSILITPFVSFIEKTSLFITKHNLGYIIFPKPSILFIILYYILLSIFLYNYKYILVFILLFIHKLSPYLDNSYIFTTLDVGEGDSLYLRLPNNRGNVLIDTGGNNSFDYNYATKRIIPYLKSIGITHLNFFISSHGDADHLGEAINLVNNFKVEKVIFNCGEFNDLENELIKVLDKKKIKYYSCIKELNMDKNKLYFLQTKEYDNENDNSNVIYTELDGYKFMFMGDASVTTENEILSKYNLPDIDVLKVGHHGSKTSSSKVFINEINPKYSIISVGKNNRYGHPNKEVLNNLEKSKIFRTDLDGSIMFKIKNNRLKIETCSP